MKYVCALIAVADVARSRELYETLLGQRVSADYGENVVFEGGFALHEKGHFSRLLDGRPVSAGTNGFELYFEHGDLDGIARVLRERGFEFVHDVREQPWRQRVLRFYDYDRHLVEIGEPVEPASGA